MIVLAACSSDKVQVAPPDELYRQATQDFVDGNYGISIQTYKYLLDHYPLDDRAEDVELRIAEAHYADEAYPEAIAAFSDFQRMHPTSPRLPESSRHHRAAGACVSGQVRQRHPRQLLSLALVVALSCW